MLPAGVGQNIQNILIWLWSTETEKKIFIYIDCQQTFVNLSDNSRQSIRLMETRMTRTVVTFILMTHFRGWHVEASWGLRSYHDNRGSSNSPPAFCRSLLSCFLIPSLWLVTITGAWFWLVRLPCCHLLKTTTQLQSAEWHKQSVGDKIRFFLATNG